MSNKTAFQMLRENWVIVLTIVSLIAGYANLQYRVGEHQQKLFRLEMRDEVKSTEINDLKIIVRELQVILQRIDTRTEDLYKRITE